MKDEGQECRRFNYVTLPHPTIYPNHNPPPPSPINAPLCQCTPTKNPPSTFNWAPHLGVGIMGLKITNAVF